MKRFIFLAAIWIAPATEAQQVIGGLGWDEDGHGIHGTIEYNVTPFHSTNRFQAALAVAARIDQDGDAWIGAGVALERHLSERVFVEFSFMPGYYHEQDDVLGGALQYRSLIGLGYDLSETSAISVSIDHLSNGGAEDFNPGSEAIAIRYRLRF